MLFPELLPATFLKRMNRFTAVVDLSSGERTSAYVPTTGRLTGVLRPGGQVWLEPAMNQNRKLRYTLVLAELEQGGFCSVNATLANQLFEEALLNRRLEAFPCDEIRREVTYKDSRFDFRLAEKNQVCWVEVKSVTCVQEGVGMFPDAPTSRGQKHLRELAELAVLGDRASVVFVAQRADATRFKSHETVDPEFTEVLRQAHAQGVEIHAYRCDVTLEGIEIADEIPVELWM